MMSSEKGEKPCLIVVDVQHGSFTIPGSPIADETGLLRRINKLIAWARSAAVPIVFTRFEGSQGTLFARDEPGFQLRETLQVDRHDIIVDKPDSDAFLRSSLQDTLARLDAGTLLLCGLQTEFCIDATCRSAYALGYKVVLVEDCHGSSDNEVLTAAQIVAHHNASLSRLWVSLSSSEDLCSSAPDNAANALTCE